MYKKVSSELNFVPREKEVLAFWKEKQIFQKSVRLRKGAKPYTFFDGPPTHAFVTIGRSPSTSANVAPLLSARFICALKLPPPRFISIRMRNNFV